MKKLTLNLSKMKGTEVLSREQLKKILGGLSGSGNQCNVYCNDNSVCDSKGGNCPTCDTNLPGVKGPNDEKGMCTY